MRIRILTLVVPAFTLSSLLILRSAVLASDLYLWEAQLMNDCLNQASVKSSKSCDSQKNVKPDCAALTDDLCNALWNQNNKGHLKVSDGEINVGKSKNSEISTIKIADLKALIESQKSLPNDLKDKAKPILTDLSNALKNEKDSKDWYRLISKIQLKWNEFITDAAEERTNKKFPKLKTIKDNDLTIEQKALYQQNYFDLKSEILNAKYKENPNWKRVERVFNTAQKDLLAEIETLKIPLDQKKQMLERVSTIKLFYKQEMNFGLASAVKIVHN